MTDTATTITPDSDSWPSIAPSWAVCAEAWPSGNLTFCRAWSLPSLFRGGEPLVVVRVEQEWMLTAPGEYVAAERPHVAAGTDALWGDWRNEDVATALEEIAAALRSGQPAAPAAEQEGEDG